MNLDTCVTSLIGEYGDNYFLICGDLNSRVGQANPYETSTVNDNCPWSNTDTCGTEYIKKSEDKVTNHFGEKLVIFGKIFELLILNGMCKGDEDEEMKQRYYSFS